MQLVIIAIFIYILYRLQGLVYHRLWSSHLHISIQFQKKCIVEGEKVVLEEELENRKWLPLPVVYLQLRLSRFFCEPGGRSYSSEDHYNRNELLSVMMNQRIRRKVELICTKRGSFEIEGAYVKAKSILLDEEYGMEIDCNSVLTVYPRSVDIVRFERLLRDTAGGQSLCPFMQEDPFLHRGVREYQIYDSMKNINWNATARTGEMKVNLVETVSSRDTYVFLNVQKESLSVHNEVIEESIRLAKTFCGFFTKKGMKNRLYTNGTNGKDREPVCVDRGSGTEYMEKVNRALTQIYVDEHGNVVSHGREEEPDFVEMYEEKLEQCAKNGQVVLISGKQDASIVRMLQKLRSRDLHFLWIVPVAKRMDYKENPQLKGYMKMWSLNFEGAGDRIRQDA